MGSRDSDDDAYEVNDEDRPRKRRRRDQEATNGDAAPGIKRPQPDEDVEEDEDYEERPRKRRDYEEESGDRTRRRRKKGRKSRANLWAIAMLHKAITVCLAIWVIGSAIAACFLPPGKEWLWGFVVIPIVIASAVCTILLAMKVYDRPVAIFLCFLTLSPFTGFLSPLFGIIGICTNLLTLVIISGKATSILKDHGIHVGFLGADMSDI